MPELLEVRRDVGGHCVGCDAGEWEDCARACPEREAVAREDDRLGSPYNDGHGGNL